MKTLNGFFGKAVGMKPQVLCVLLMVLLGVGLPPARGQDEDKAKHVNDPKEILRAARTIHIAGTKLFPPDPLEKKLFDNKEFQEWGYVLQKDRGGAHLVIELDRKEFTWDFTYRLVHPRSGVILGSGKVIAWDGVRAAPGIADQLVKRIKQLREPPEPEKPKKEKSGGLA